MTDHMRAPGRRAFLRAAATAGGAAIVGLQAGRVAAEPPPETTTLRILQFPSGCRGPVHALRLCEAGIIRSSPQKIIALGSELRFINELKRELKT